MMLFVLVYIALVFGQVGAKSFQSARPACKYIPGSIGWPSEAEWAKLNDTLGGVLFRPKIAAAACHKEFPEYDEQVCKQISLHWNSSQWHSDHPTSSLFQNTNSYSCLPGGNFPCSADGYPLLVVNATSAAHVKAAIDFARENNIRLNIKSTGHDFLGRSVQPKSLSIWTHHMRSIKWHEKSYTLQGCNITIPGASLTTGAGVQMRQLYREAADRQMMVVGGNSRTVSVGGYMTGGGHSSLSPLLGMGTDNVLEMEVVKADGEVIIVNECMNPDLFWAMRGGGGSTFGVVTSFTIRAFETVPIVQWAGYIIGNSSRSANWDAVAHLHKEWPKRLSPMGISGHIIGNPNNLTRNIGVQVIMPNVTSTSSLKELLDPIWKDVYKVTKLSVIFYGNYTHYDSWGDWQFPKNRNPKADDSTSYAGNGVSKLITSWLWNSKALNSPKLKQTLMNTVDNETVIWNVFTSGPGSHKGPLRGGSNAVNPAWRSAYVRATAEMQWTGLDRAKLKERKVFLKKAFEAMQSIAPDGGAYVNEMDPDIDDPLRQIYGVNYPRLLKVKKQVDPNDVFWCKACVGSDLWEEGSDGTLCRKHS